MAKLAWLCHSAQTFTDGDNDKTLYNLVRANLPHGWQLSPDKAWQSLVVYSDASGAGVGGASTRSWLNGGVAGATRQDIDGAAVVIVGTMITDFIWPYDSYSLLRNGGSLTAAAAEHIAIIDALSARGKHIIWHAPYAMDQRTRAGGNPYTVCGGPLDAEIDPEAVSGITEGGDFTDRCNRIMSDAVAIIKPAVLKRGIPVIDHFTATATGEITIGYDDDYETGYQNLGLHISAQSHLNLYADFMPRLEAALRRFQGGI